MLDLYSPPYNARYPVICRDEPPKPRRPTSDRRSRRDRDALPLTTTHTCGTVPAPSGYSWNRWARGARPTPPPGVRAWTGRTIKSLADPPRYRQAARLIRVCDKRPCASLPTRRPEQVSRKERIRSHWVSVIGGHPRANTQRARLAGRITEGAQDVQGTGPRGRRGSNKGTAWPPATTNTRNSAWVFGIWRQIGSGCNPKPTRPNISHALSIQRFPSAPITAGILRCRT